jgi:ACS family hexuronate transporter-like MFS transporter
MGSGFGGMVFALITGWLVEHYSYVPVFWLFGLIPIVCVSIIWIFMGRLDPDRQFLKEPIASLI